MINIVENSRPAINYNELLTTCKSADLGRLILKTCLLTYLLWYFQKLIFFKFSRKVLLINYTYLANIWCNFKMGSWLGSFIFNFIGMIVFVILSGIINNMTESVTNCQNWA